MNIPDAVSFAQLNEAMEKAVEPAPPELPKLYCNNTATPEDVIKKAADIVDQASQTNEWMVFKIVTLILLDRLQQSNADAALTHRERSNFELADSMDLDARTMRQAYDILRKTTMANNDWLANQ